MYLLCFIIFWGGLKNVSSMGRAGIDPLTAWYINVNLWSCLLSGGVDLVQNELRLLDIAYI